MKKKTPPEDKDFIVETSVFTARRSKCCLCNRVMPTGQYAVRLRSRPDNASATICIECHALYSSPIMAKRIESLFETRFPKLVAKWRAEGKRDNKETT